MYYTDDPIADYDRYSAHQESELNKLPKCSYCDKPIQDDFLYEINDEIICEECIKHFKKLTEDFVE